MNIKNFAFLLVALLAVLSGVLAELDYYKS